jgi:hypothetical protein
MEMTQLMLIEYFRKGSLSKMMSKPGGPAFIKDRQTSADFCKIWSQMVAERATGHAANVEVPPLHVVVQERADLLAMTALLSMEGVHGVVSSSGLDAAQAQALCLGLCQRGWRGLHPLLPADVPVRSWEIGDYQQKSVAAAEVARLAAAHGLRRRACDQVEQATDELLMNALYDAPVDVVDGERRPRYLHMPAAERVGRAAAPGEGALLRCGGDGRRFVVVVRDPFGSLRRRTVLSYLHRCARAEAERSNPVEHRPGGAGVGLYLIARCATELIFRLRAGQMTEVVYAIDCEHPPPSLRVLLIDEQ